MHAERFIQLFKHSLRLGICSRAVKWRVIIALILIFMQDPSASRGHPDPHLATQGPHPEWATAIYLHNCRIKMGYFYGKKEEVLKESGVTSVFLVLTRRSERKQKAVTVLYSIVHAAHSAEWCGERRQRLREESNFTPLHLQREPPSRLSVLFFFH